MDTKINFFKENVLWTPSKGGVHHTHKLDAVLKEGVRLREGKVQLRLLFDLGHRLELGQLLHLHLALGLVSGVVVLLALSGNELLQLIPLHLQQIQ